MAKKYLLYIHDELFENEKEKSRLVNNLLERHYHDTVDGGKTQDDIHADIKKAQEAVAKAKVPTQDRVLMDETGQLHGTDMQFCQHNAVKGFCKKGCK